MLLWHCIIVSMNRNSRIVNLTSVVSMKSEKNVHAEKLIKIIRLMYKILRSYLYDKMSIKRSILQFVILYSPKKHGMW